MSKFMHDKTTAERRAQWPQYESTANAWEKPVRVASDRVPRADTAKFEEIEATRATAAAVDPLQQRDDWQGQRLGHPSTVAADRALMTGLPRFGAMGRPERAEPRYDRKKIGLCNAKDLEVSRLQGTVRREQFILWRDGLE